MPQTIQQLFDLTGKTAVITGGSHGLGLQMAHALGEAGARIMLCAREADALELACADLQDAGIDARWVAADCALEAGLQKLVSETLQRMGDIDILVNSADALRGATVPDHPANELATAWDKVMNLSVRGYFLLSQLVARRSMIGRGGCIINVAAMPDESAGMSRLACQTSQGAVINLTRALAGEWRQDRIKVNAIFPGDDLDVKGVTLLFASAAGRHITGQCVAVDGGLGALTGA